jgi:hypothetical protein
MQVQNIPGTGDDEPPSGFASWKDFYKSHHLWPKMCRIHGCTRKKLHGGHVNILGVRGDWIIPICARHNHPSETEEMSVNANTVAVLVDEEWTGL